MSKEKKKTKFNPALIMPLVFGGILGFVIGIFGITYLESKFPADAPFWYGIVAYILFFVALYVQIIIHEGGHLIFGLLSGYEFSSFRIASFTIARINGKLCVKRFSLAGTGGQCLMVAPEPKDGKVPVMLYNFGGAILNLITGLIALVLCIIVDNFWVASISISFAICGILFALLNGIPLKTKELNNDGHNALSLSKDKTALNAFCTQLKANAMQMDGIRLKDMPEEMFEKPSDEVLKNPIVSAIGVFRCNRLLDMHCFEEAEREIEHLFSIKSGIAGLHKNLLTADLIYLKLILERDFEQVNELFTDELESFMKSMPKFPSIIRTRYVYALLGEQNRENAEKFKAKFEAIKNYPYESDLESERELMAIADKKASEICL